VIGSGRCHGPNCRTGNAGARLAGLAARGVECGTSCPTCGAMLRATAAGELVPVASPFLVPRGAAYPLVASRDPQVAHSGWRRLFNRWRRE
jgi:hypothetical protein